MGGHATKDAVEKALRAHKNSQEAKDGVKSDQRDEAAVCLSPDSTTYTVRI